MKISFLYKISEEKPTTPNNTVYNLSLDRTVELACSDIASARYFLKVASKPLTKIENIYYRREILNDFINNRELYFELRDLLGRLYDGEKLNEKERKYRYSLLRSGDDNLSFQNTKQALQMTAISMRKVLAVLNDLYSLLKDKQLSSEGFLQLKNRLSGIVDNNAYKELIDISNYFNNISDIESVESVLKIDADFNISESRLVACNEPSAAEEINDGILFSIFRKKKKDEMPAVQSKKLKQISLPLGNSVMSAAFSEPARMMDYIISALYADFDGIREELLFYKAGMKLIDFFKEKNVPFIYPEITEKRVFNCKGLLDTYLCAYYPVVDGVIPNDAAFGDENCGILVFGKNNSGKTVYLRSIGTAQLFAQAGFPVTAEKAVIGIRSGIFTQFASGEKEFEEGNEAGRFEQEVREISALVDSSDENALILFNETFQTTAYSEGSEGLYHILWYLSAKNTNWVLVSHLTDLEGRYNKGVRTLHTSEGYKMTEDKK